MIAICKRNLKLYFSNKATVFFSLLGALIAFGLYLLFLRKNMVAQFNQLENGAAVADFWVLGGLLATTSITTSFTALGQLIKDKAENKFMDFVITGKKIVALIFGYFLSAFIIAVLMQSVVLIVCLSYFYLQDHYYFTIEIALKLAGIILLSALNATAINLVVCSFIQSDSTLRTISSLLAALAGFMCTAYLPVGSFSGPALTILKLLPASYVSSSFRRILLLPLLQSQPKDDLTSLKEYLGIGYRWHTQLTGASLDLSVLILSTLLCFTVLFLCYKKIKQVRLASV